MRPTHLWLLMTFLSASPALGQLADLDGCLAALAQDPSATREAAARWRALGGGTSARICEAFALDALGASRTAAERLTELAQERGTGLAAHERAALFDRAGSIWQNLGELRLARLTLETAARLDPGDARTAAAARAQAAEEDWAAVLETLAPLRGRLEGDFPALHARALVAEGRLEEAADVIRAAPPSSALALSSARLQAARGEREAALKTLAGLDAADDPALRAEVRAFLWNLLTAHPPGPASAVTRPMPRRP